MSQQGLIVKEDIFNWIEVTDVSQDLFVYNGYIANNAGLITFTLPLTSAIGNRIIIVGKGSGLYKIAQNSGQIIHYINADTTIGISGSLTAIEQFASIEILCTTTYTNWTVLDSSGNFTVV